MTGGVTWSVNNDRHEKMFVYLAANKGIQFGIGACLIFVTRSPTTNEHNFLKSTAMAADIRTGSLKFAEKGARRLSQRLEVALCFHSYFTDGGQ